MGQPRVAPNVRLSTEVSTEPDAFSPRHTPGIPQLVQTYESAQLTGHRHAVTLHSRRSWRGSRVRNSRVLRFIGVSAALATTTASLVLAGPAAPSSAYCASPDIAWPLSSFNISGNLSINATWDSALGSSANQWSNYPNANWTVNWLGIGYTGAVHAKMRKSSPPGGFGGVPVLTDLQTSGSTILAGDIYFNDAFTWNLTGTMSSAQLKADVRTVAIHELGHEVYLNHPDSCGALTMSEIAAAMYPNWAQKWFTNTDDIDGLQVRK
jgi:hypothetical protein